MNKNIDILCDLAFGDSGKGKIVDALVEKNNYSLVARFAAGPNAGHTIYKNTGEKVVFNHLPSASLYPDVLLYLGSQMVIEPKKLRQEIETGNVNLNNLRIAYNAHIILDKHIEEDKKENSHIGTTNKGIGPCYKDKIGRIGLRFCDWLNSEHSDLTAFFKSCVVDVSEELNEKLNSGMKLMCEGAQGTFLDIDHGTYPFVTSSNCLAQAALVSLGLSPHRVNRIYGVTKAYTTRVGNGPFETEIKEKYIADKLIELGKEYGSTTGRKRRVGWLDLNLLKKAIRLNGVTDLVITKIDVLKQLGEELDIELPVFDTETMVHSFKTQQLMNSIEGFHLYIEEQTDTDVSIISFGPNKNDIKYF